LDGGSGGLDWSLRGDLSHNVENSVVGFSGEVLFSGIVEVLGDLSEGLGVGFSL